MPVGEGRVIDISKVLHSNVENYPS